MNKPTIDGVSRELLYLKLGDLLNDLQGQYPSARIAELQALLDAPVVERQPVESPTAEMEEAGCQEYMRVDGKSGAWCLHKSSMGHAYVAMRKLDPEVGALQSTIAQLQARIAELESARGEPVAWMTRCIKGVREGAVEQVDGHEDVENTEYWTPAFPVFTAPPAPVAVSDKYDEVLLPFLAMMRNELHANAGKGDRPGWLSMTPGECLLEIYYHLGKLQKGVRDGNELWITEYSADVANMAMMLADICGCLDATAALDEVRK